MNILTDKQQEVVKQAIQDELLKRGFTAKITTFEEKEGTRGYGVYINLLTEPFQTVPVLFKEIRVVAFNSNVSKETLEEETKTTKSSIWISVSVSYTHFDGGTNGSKLFDIVGHFFNDSDQLHYEIR